jgi:hypothetical protein
MIDEAMIDEAMIGETISHYRVLRKLGGAWFAAPSLGQWEVPARADKNPPTQD